MPPEAIVLDGRGRLIPGGSEATIAVQGGPALLVLGPGTATRKEAAVWAGRAAQEAMVSDAGAGDEDGASSESADQSELSPEPTTAGAN